MIDRALERATDSHWQSLDVDKQAHAALKRQVPKVLWFTGLPGAGKSTVANLVEKKLHSLGKHTYILDGDNLRHNLNRDLGYEDADQVEHIRRIAEVANILIEAGIIVIAPLISPFRNERRMAREIFGEDEFVEIYLDTPLEICEQRDKTGAYRKVRSGELNHIAGIDASYEPPEQAEFQFDGGNSSPEEIAMTIVDQLFSEPYPLEWEI
jgi:bifunctional enzyme CysN/CysC